MIFRLGRMILLGLGSGVLGSSTARVSPRVGVVPGGCGAGNGRGQDVMGKARMRARTSSSSV